MYFIKLIYTYEDVEKSVSNPFLIKKKVIKTLIEGNSMMKMNNLALK